MAGHGIRCRPGPARPTRGTRLWREAPQLRLAVAAARVHKEQRLRPRVPRARAREGPLCRGVGPAGRAAQTSGPLSLTALQPPARPRAPCDDAPDNGIELCREATRKQNELKRNGLLFPPVGTCLGTAGGEAGTGRPRLRAFWAPVTEPRATRGRVSSAPPKLPLRPSVCRAPHTRGWHVSPTALSCSPRQRSPPARGGRNVETTPRARERASERLGPKCQGRRLHFLRDICHAPRPERFKLLI